MSDDKAKPTPKARPRVFRVSLVTIGVVSLLYLLSQGYAYRLIRTDRMTYETYDAAYAPIIWLEIHSEYFGKFDEWYQNLWWSDYAHWKQFIERATPQSADTNKTFRINK